MLHELRTGKRLSALLSLAIVMSAAGCSSNSDALGHTYPAFRYRLTAEVLGSELAADTPGTRTIRCRLLAKLGAYF